MFEIHAFCRSLALRFKTFKYTFKCRMSCKSCRLRSCKKFITVWWRKRSNADWLCCNLMVLSSWDTSWVSFLHKSCWHLVNRMHNWRDASWKTNVQREINTWLNWKSFHCDWNAFKIRHRIHWQSSCSKDHCISSSNWKTRHLKYVSIHAWWCSWLNVKMHVNQPNKTIDCSRMSWASLLIAIP